MNLEIYTFIQSNNMDVYIVWNFRYNCDEVPCFGDKDIIGVFSDELTAYKVACITQIKKYKSSCRREKNDQPRIWLEKHPIPSSNDVLEVWDDYLCLLTSDDVITEMNDVMRIKDWDFEVINVTKKQVDEMVNVNLTISDDSDTSDGE
jgi:hypothetical protein